MRKNIVKEGNLITRGYRKQAVSNQFNLEQRVKAIHQERIKHLQNEVVEISLQTNQNKKIVPLLEEIKKLRILLSYAGNNRQSC